MAAPSLCPFVAGPVEVWVDTGAGNTLEFLGRTTNGIDLQNRGYTSDVPGDQNGGDQGVPIDTQYFGQEHIIDGEYSTFDDAVLTKVEARVNPGSGITNPVVGFLMNCGGGSYRVVLKAANFQRNYVNCFVSGSVGRTPVGSQYTRARVTFIARVNPDTGVLFNTDMTGTT